MAFRELIFQAKVLFGNQFYKGMNLHITEASSLAQIDHQLDNRQYSPAEYEIVRQVVYGTADYEYASLLRFEEKAVSKGAAAIAARTPIIVDVPSIQVSIVPLLQQTFCNSVYCCQTTVTRPQKRKTRAAWGLETLAKNHINSIYVIGQDQTALATFAELTEKKFIKPALVILTAPIFIEQDMKQWLKTSALPRIYVDSSKGNATVGAIVVNALVTLAWQAYEINPYLEA